MKNTSGIHAYTQWYHNHSAKSLQVLSYNDIPDQVSWQIQLLFDESNSPGIAYKWFIVKCAFGNDLDFHFAHVDKSNVPRKSVFNNLFT